MFKILEITWLFTRNTHWLLLLIGRALSHPGISAYTKSRLALSGLYAFSPVDLLPELLLGTLGYIDDGGVAIGALHRLMNGEDPSLIRSLWGGTAEDLGKIQHMLQTCSMAIVGLVSGGHGKKNEGNLG